MKYFFVLFIISGLLFACKHKKVSLAGNVAVDKEDFMSSFPAMPFPYQVTDSVFDQENPDSALISYKVFTQFVPDTVLRKHFSKGAVPKMYPLGKVKEGNNVSYLFIKAVTSSRELVYVLCFDKSDKFVAAKALFGSGSDKGVTDAVTIDSRFTLTVMHQRKISGGETFYTRDAYVLTTGGSFMLILTESNETSAKSRAIINPIDTLPRKHRFSGDYIQDKLNFISIRDGKDASHIVFFVHFEKEGGSCKGELKGEAKLIGPNLAHYTSAGDPCTVNFSFTPLKVSMKEIEACGNHRDIKCFFEGAFMKQKEAKKKIVKRHR